MYVCHPEKNPNRNEVEKKINEKEEATFTFPVEPLLAQAVWQ